MCRRSHTQPDNSTHMCSHNRNTYMVIRHKELTGGTICCRGLGTIFGGSPWPAMPRAAPASAPPSCCGPTSAGAAPRAAAWIGGGGGGGEVVRGLCVAVGGCEQTTVRRAGGGICCEAACVRVGPAAALGAVPAHETGTRELETALHGSRSGRGRHQVLQQPQGLALQQPAQTHCHPPGPFAVSIAGKASDLTGSTHLACHTPHRDTAAEPSDQQRPWMLTCCSVARQLRE
jgi:hypothetical protein